MNFRMGVGRGSYFMVGINKKNGPDILGLTLGLHVQYKNSNVILSFEVVLKNILPNLVVGFLL